MARSERQKLKLLYLVRLLEAESDQSHPVTVSRMLSYLEEHGIRAERKSVYDDLAGSGGIWPGFGTPAPAGPAVTIWPAAALNCQS